MGGLNLNLVVLGGWSAGSSGALAAMAFRVEMLAPYQRPKGRKTVSTTTARAFTMALRIAEGNSGSPET